MQMHTKCSARLIEYALCTLSSSKMADVLCLPCATNKIFVELQTVRDKKTAAKVFSLKH